MPKKKHNEVVAGVIVLVILAALVGIIFWLGASRVFQTHGQIVSFYVPQQQGSTGLQKGAEVTYGDAPVGRLDEIVADPQSGRCLYHVTLNRKDMTVYSNGKAKIVSQPIGLAKLVITENGSAPSPLADDKDPIPLHGGLDQAMASITESAENMRVITDAIRKQLDASAGGKMMSNIDIVINDLKTAASNIVTISGNVRTATDPNLPDSALAKMTKAVDDIGEMTSKAKPKVDQILTSGADMAQRLDEYAKKDIGDLLTKLRDSNTQIYKMAQDFAQVGQQAKEMVAMNRDNVDKVIDNMAVVSANLKSMSAEVRRAPWLLLRTPTEKETRQQSLYAAARAFSDGATQLDDAASKLNSLLKASPQGLAGQTPEVKALVKELQERFAEFNKFEQSLWNELQKSQ